MICKLCLEEKPLRNSHIIPKFIINWTKKTGSGRLRIQKDFDKPVQDGISLKLLCVKCEGLFNRYETTFANKVFHPYTRGKLINNEINADADLYYFLVSVLWRILVIFKDDGKEYVHKEDLDLAEIEWRNYLYNGGQLSKFHNFHLVFNDNILNEFEVLKNADIKIMDELFPEFEIPNLSLELYLNRSLDMDIIESENSSMLYAKFSKFTLLGEIHGDFDDSFIGTKLKGNKILVDDQAITDLDFLGFIYHRALNVKTFRDLSESQKIANNNRFIQMEDKIKNSDYWKIVSKFN